MIGLTWLLLLLGLDYIDEVVYLAGRFFIYRGFLYYSADVCLG
jgi:hypothetical protein